MQVVGAVVGGKIFIEVQEEVVQEQNAQEQEEMVQEVQQMGEEEEETYATRHRRRTRRSMQTYPSSPELGEDYHGRGKARKFRSL
jgi:hypothetical protein